METVILITINLSFILFGIWNISSELKKGYDLLNPKRRSLVALRVVLGGLFPLLIGVSSIYLTLTNPFSVLPTY